MRRYSDPTCHRHRGKKYQLDYGGPERNESYLHSNAFKGSGLLEQQTFSSLQAVSSPTKPEEIIQSKSPEQKSMKIFVIIAAIIF